jgi:hypothetical protein
MFAPRLLQPVIVGIVQYQIGFAMERLLFAIVAATGLVGAICSFFGETYAWRIGGLVAGVVGVIASVYGFILQTKQSEFQKKELERIAKEANSAKTMAITASRGGWR